MKIFCIMLFHVAHWVIHVRLFWVNCTRFDESCVAWYYGVVAFLFGSTFLGISVFHNLPDVYLKKQYSFYKPNF